MVMDFLTGVGATGLEMTAPEATVAPHAHATATPRAVAHAIPRAILHPSAMLGATHWAMTVHPITHYRAPHAAPHPMIRKGHLAAAHHAAPESRRLLELVAHGAQFNPFGGYLRGTVVVGGVSPATIQLAGSDATVSMPLAQHVAPATVVAGGSVAAVMFDPSNPADGLIVAAY